MVYLITAWGDSGKKYSVWFECEDEIDAEVMVRDCFDNAEIEGTLIEVQNATELGSLERLQ